MRTRRFARLAAPILIFLLAFVPRAIYPVSRPMQWYTRAVRFGDAVLAQNWAGTYERYHRGVSMMSFTDTSFDGSYAVLGEMSRVHVRLVAFILASELFLLACLRRSKQFDALLSAPCSGIVREGCLSVHNVAGKSLAHRRLPVQAVHVDLPGRDGLMNQVTVLVRPE